MNQELNIKMRALLINIAIALVLAGVVPLCLWAYGAILSAGVPGWMVLMQGLALGLVAASLAVRVLASTPRLTAWISQK